MQENTFNIIRHEGMQIKTAMRCDCRMTKVNTATPPKTDEDAGTLGRPRSAAGTEHWAGRSLLLGHLQHV